MAEFERAVSQPGARGSSGRSTTKQAGARYLDFHTSNKKATSVLVYRDTEWVRLPTCLLVEGDVIALLQGELNLHAHLEYVAPEVRVREQLVPEREGLRRQPTDTPGSCGPLTPPSHTH